MSRQVRRWDGARHKLSWQVAAAVQEGQSRGCRRPGQGVAPATAGYQARPVFTHAVAVKAATSQGTPCVVSACGKHQARQQGGGGRRRGRGSKQEVRGRAHRLGAAGRAGPATATGQSVRRRHTSGAEHSATRTHARTHAHAHAQVALPARAGARAVGRQVAHSLAPKVPGAPRNLPPHTHTPGAHTRNMACQNMAAR